MGGCWENNRGGATEEWWSSFERFFCWGHPEIGSDLASMKGDGEDSRVRNFLSLGSASSSRSGNERDGRGGEETLLNLNMLSSHGLSMLAGGSNGGFSLKPPAVGNLVSLRNLAMAGGGGGSKVTGGGFTGFYRASANRSSNSSANVSTTTRRSLLAPGMKRRFETEAKEEALGGAAASSSHRGGGSSGIIAGKGEPSLKADVENLTPDERWRLILKLGKHTIL